MSIGLYFAHSIEDIDPFRWQGLAQHLTAVGQLAGMRGQKFGAGRADALHDLGIYTDGFQSRLRGHQEPLPALARPRLRPRLLNRAGPRADGGPRANISGRRGRHDVLDLAARLFAILMAQAPEYREYFRVLFRNLINAAIEGGPSSTGFAEEGWGERVRSRNSRHTAARSVGLPIFARQLLERQISRIRQWTGQQVIDEMRL